MEEMDFRSMLDKFAAGGFQKGEQVILSNFGTNQTLLSIIFQAPNEIKILSMQDNEGSIYRAVDLFCAGEKVCWAQTTVPKKKNKPEVLADILEGKLGLGQIVVKHNLPNKRVLKKIGRDDSYFWRTYVIEGPDVFLEITEEFPREPFILIGWL